MHMKFHRHVDAAELIGQHGLVVLEQCDFTQPADLVQWLGTQGSIWRHPHYLRSQGEEVGIINNSDKSHPQAGTFWNERPAGDWHIDAAWREDRPRVACLYGHRVTASGLGNTWFADGHRAAMELSSAFLAQLRQLSIVHYRQPNHRYTQAAWERHYGRPGANMLDVAFQSGSMPLVGQDSRGREFIRLSASKAVTIQGWTQQESRGLIDFLAQHCTRPEYVTQHVWQQGQLVMWENDRWNHYGVYDYAGHERELWRAYLG